MLLLASGTEGRGTIRDVSATGFRLDGDFGCSTGEGCWLKKSSYQLRRAQIVRTDAEGIGCEFTPALNDNDLADILADFAVR